MSASKTPQRFVCIHGHFYQPPRENPWLEAIEPQPSAAPFHDWNDRILHECYAANASARILDEEGLITRIANNYASMSFNFGPTLLGWLETHSPAVYAGVLEADVLSRDRFGGHGSAIAQAYNHIILPLATRRDKQTQVRWGIADFEHRFGRKPEGMWLPETAVDSESLDVLAEHGIAYAILAPHQAQRVRAPGAEWTDTPGNAVDTRRPYKVALPSGRSIAVFFYDGAASRAIAFERLLADGSAFVERLVSLHGDERPALGHIAVDGETFGHHHRYGDMALAYAADAVDHMEDVRLTNYGEYLELFPPTWDAEIVERTSWSCAHGVQRWSDDCGCNSGGHSDWKQTWRKPLRAALDWLRDQVDAIYERAAAPLLHDPWAARDAYIEVILDRSPARMTTFERAHATGDLSARNRQHLLELLEMQRNAQLMYTSCAWFFDEISGTETVQVLRYAARVIELAELAANEALAPSFLERLEAAPSNLEQFANGRKVFETHVEPAAVDLRKVVAHYAVTALLKRGEKPSGRVYAYNVDNISLEHRSAGKSRLVIGHVHVTSQVTRESGAFCYAALHLGDHNIAGGVRRYLSDDSYQRIVADVTAPFSRADLVATTRAMDTHFEDRSFSLASLFGDQQRDALMQILQTPVTEATAALLRLYRNNAPLLRYLASHDLPPPRVLQTLEEMALELRIRSALAESDRPDLIALRRAIESAGPHMVSLDQEITLLWERAAEHIVDGLRGEADEAPELERLVQLLTLARTAGLDLNLWRVQNVCWELIETPGPIDDPDRTVWNETFATLCGLLKLRLA